MTLVSYAQNGEDVVLARAFPGRDRGFYVDVGASDPDVDSVTRHFYDRGWCGINVEPAALTLDALRAARPRDVNLGVGVSTRPGERVFHELPREMTGCSTFSDELADGYRQHGWETRSRTVDVTTLAALCEQYATYETIDFLKIDVEGGEADVLAGADFERFRPRVLIVEATQPGTRIPSHHAWEPLVINARYRLALFDGLNRFYAREEDEELVKLLSAPANVLDDYVQCRWAQCQDRARVLEVELQAAQRAADASGADAAASRSALDATRDALASSQASLRDARAELAATRAALIAQLASERHPAPAR